MKEKTKFLYLAALTALSLISYTGMAQNYTPIKVEAKPWQGEQDVPWQFFDTRIIDSLHGFDKNQTPAKFNRYGSDLSLPQEKATGFFRTQKIDARWWIIDPEGYRNIHRTITSLSPGKSPRNVATFQRRFQAKENWMKETADSLVHYGFTGAGAWSDDDSIIEYNKTADIPLCYAPILNFMSSYGKKRGGTYSLPGNTGYPNQCIFVFDPDFETFCDEHAKQALAYKDDPNLFGYFSDNEMPLSKANLEGYLTLKNEQDHGRIAAEAWLKQKGITRMEITEAIKEEFVGYVADRYFEIVSKALKKYDPNHIYLGSRLHGNAKDIPSVWQSAGKYCEVIAVNYYGAWTPDPNLMRMWEKESQRPFMITEFYTKGMDAGLANTSGAGWCVRTQRDKGYAYQNFCLGLLESKNCVGWQYFKYQDNDPEATGVDRSNIDSNKGIVNNYFEYYHPLMELMGQMNNNIYHLVNYFDTVKKVTVPENH